MKYKILLILFVLALASSLILSLAPLSEICDPGKGCDVVQHSSYSSLFGIKNSHYGVAVFTLAILLIFSHIKNPTEKKKNLIHVIVIIGSLVALYFIYLQQFVLTAFCKYCMVVDVSMLAALSIIIFNWKK